MTGRERHAASLLIRGGSVVDGTGCAAFGADVRVHGGLIVEVGSDLAPDGERELDARGAVVAPGFIDTHTHLDPAVFWDPRCDPMPQHGVTTVVTGNCSLSLAPVAAEQRVELASLFSYIEDMPQSVLARSVPWTWTSWPEYQQALRHMMFGVNVAALVGHTPLRMFVMGSQAWERAATVSERSRIAALLDDCLLAGAFGLSTSLFDEDAVKRPVPSRLADDAELDGLAQVLARRSAVLTFIPDVASHARTLLDVERVATLCRRRGVTAAWNGLFHAERKPECSIELLEQAVWELTGRQAEVFGIPHRGRIAPGYAADLVVFDLGSLVWHEEELVDDLPGRALRLRRPGRVPACCSRRDAPLRRWVSRRVTTPK